MENSHVVHPGAKSEESSDDVNVFCNYEIDEEAHGKRRGLPVHILRNGLLQLTGGWPKRVEDILFCPGPDGKPIYLESSTKFTAWLDEGRLVDWAKGSDMITQERFHANLSMTAEPYNKVETFPHWPQLPNTYYMHPPLPETDGSFLETLVDFFNPPRSPCRPLR